jgi:uncharacterized membrane protein YvlD (DUF360 family)
MTVHGNLVLDIESADKLIAAIDMYVIRSVIAGIRLKNVTPALLSAHISKVSRLIPQGKK